MTSKVSLAPSNSFTSSSPENAVKLRIGSEAPNNYDPITVPQLLYKAASEAGDHHALRVKRNGDYITWTYEDYLRDVRNAARAMLQIGQGENSGVCILGSNNPEWMFANLGAIYCGGIAVGIYPTSSPDACRYIMDHCQCQIIFVEDEEQLKKILEVKSSLPSLKQIVQFIGDPPNESGVISWKEFMALGQEKGLEGRLQETLSKMAVNKCCQIVYTSGTTGPPKGVMLSHDNITFLPRVGGQFYGYRHKEERLISYLPLNHAGALMLDIYWAITYTMTVIFADKNALKGTLMDTIRDVRPTIFGTVPRVFEKIQEKLMETGSKTTGFKKMVASWAKATGYHYNKNLIDHPDQTNTIQYNIADLLFFSKVKEQLGFDKCRYFIGGGAPTNISTIEYFMSLDILIIQGYGMSESTSLVSTNVCNGNRLGSVGRCFPGLSIKLIADGEICIQGRNVMMGYLHDPKATKEVFTEDGFLKSGDLGELDSDGFVYITGRRKELLITAGGENIPPIPIEEHLKNYLPILSNAMVIGDKKKHLSCLLTLKVDLEPNSLHPSDKLSSEALDWCKNQGSKAQRVSEIIDTSDDKVFPAIQEGINKYNNVAVSNAQKIQKWIIIPKDFSVATEELGPTLKMKRFFILEKYDNLIQTMYA